MIYTIQATLEWKTPKGTQTLQIPTFFLDSKVQGIIIDTNHAWLIANEIVNPTKNKNITPHITVLHD